MNITMDMYRDWCDPDHGYSDFNGSLGSYSMRVGMVNGKLAIIRHEGGEVTGVATEANCYGHGKKSYIPHWLDPAGYVWSDYTNTMVDPDFTLDEIAAGSSLIAELQKD